MRRLVVVGWLLQSLCACRSDASLGAPPGADSGTKEVAPTPKALATGLEYPPPNLVSDGTSLFFVGGQSIPYDHLNQLPVEGGSMTPIVSWPSGGMVLAVDTSNVYFPGDGNFIDWAPKTGATASQIKTLPGKPGTILDGVDYWLEDRSTSSEASYDIYRMPLTSGSVELLGTLSVAGNGYSLAASQMGVTATTVYVLLPSMVLSAPLASLAAGATATTFSIPPIGNAAAIVSDAEAVFINDGQEVMALSGDSDVAFLGSVTSTGRLLDTLAVDATYVYWADQVADGTINRAPRAGGATIVLAHDTSPLAVAVDDQAVYWSDAGGSIFRLDKSAM